MIKTIFDGLALMFDEVLVMLRSVKVQIQSVGYTVTSTLVVQFAENCAKTMEFGDLSSRADNCNVNH